MLRAGQAAGKFRRVKQAASPGEHIQPPAALPFLLACAVAGKEWLRFCPAVVLEEPGVWQRAERERGARLGRQAGGPALLPSRRERVAGFGQKDTPV